LDHFIAALAGGRVRGDRRGKSEESDGEGGEAHDGWLELSS
jgi:hypothetical protein